MSASAAVVARYDAELRGFGPTLPDDLASGARQHACDPDQDGRVAVVPARVHPAVDRRAVLEVVRLLDRQRVHVRPQPDGLLALAGQMPEHPGAGLVLAALRTAGQAGLVRDACLFQLALDDLAGAILLVAELGMSVQVVADGDQVGKLIGNEPAQVLGGDGHGGMVAEGGNS